MEATFSQYHGLPVDRHHAHAGCFSASQGAFFPAHPFPGLAHRRPHRLRAGQCRLAGAPSTQGWKVLDQAPFGLLTFHLFAFSFVGIGFLETARASDSSKVVLRGALWIALLFTMMFSVQALLGKGIFSGWATLFGGSFETVNGYLLGAGFTQGPGQTLAYASIWEETYHTANAINTGLAFAAVGFLVAGLVGVPLALYGIKRGWVSCKEGERAFPGAFVRPA